LRLSSWCNHRHLNSGQGQDAVWGGFIEHADVPKLGSSARKFAGRDSGDHGSEGSGADNLDRNVLANRVLPGKVDSGESSDRGKGLGKARISAAMKHSEGLASAVGHGHLTRYFIRTDAAKDDSERTREPRLDGLRHPF
jgi:hypothetical protein